MECQAEPDLSRIRQDMPLQNKRHCDLYRSVFNLTRWHPCQAVWGCFLTGNLKDTLEWLQKANVNHLYPWWLICVPPKLRVKLSTAFPFNYGLSATINFIAFCYPSLSFFFKPELGLYISLYKFFLKQHHDKFIYIFQKIYLYLFKMCK